MLKGKNMSDSFIHELFLKTDPHDLHIVSIRLEMGRYLYNAVLHEGLLRLKRMKESKLWKKANSLSCSLEKTKFYQKAIQQYGLSDFSLQSYAIKVKGLSEIKKHLDAHVCQKIATRAYCAIKQYLFKKRGNPRFKRKGWFSSVEGKSNLTGIRWRKNKIYWRGLVLEAILDKKDPNQVQAHALSCKTKYCRLILRKIKGKRLIFVQLIQKGKPLIKPKNKASKQTIGLDIGPSSIAVFSEQKAWLTAFCSKLQPLHLKTRVLQRKMDRSKRAMNPDNYQANKKVKTKVVNWKKSNRYLQYQNQLFEIFRCLKTYRKRLHGTLANEIIRFGNIIRTEKLSYKGFQKRYGKSIGFRGPSLFLQILCRKAENAGGKFEEFSTINTCLSQICHQCETKKKKPLSQRWHQCSCGLKPVQRDLYSAFLARHVEKNKLNIKQAQKAYSGANLLLGQAMLRLDQTASGKSRLASFGLAQSQSGSFVKDRSTVSEAKDVVGNIPESLGEFTGIAVRTSRL